jgi:hypothetical protein
VSFSPQFSQGYYSISKGGFKFQVQQVNLFSLQRSEIFIALAPLFNLAPLGAKYMVRWRTGQNIALLWSENSYGVVLPIEFAKKQKPVGFCAKTFRAFPKSS